MKAIFLVIFAFLAPGVVADEVSVSEVKKIQSELKSVPALEVQFTQTQYTALRDKERPPVKGHAKFARPAKFRWAIESENPEEIIFDGELLQQYRPAEKTLLKHATNSKVAQEISELTRLVLNTEHLFEKYDLESAERDKQVLSLKLKPKKSSDVTQVQLRVSTMKNRMYFKSVKILYQGGNWWAVEFKNPRTKPIEDAVFKFVPPADVKVTTIN